MKLGPCPMHKSPRLFTCCKLLSPHRCLFLSLIILLSFIAYIILAQSPLKLTPLPLQQHTHVGLKNVRKGKTEEVTPVQSSMTNTPGGDFQPASFNSELAAINGSVPFFSQTEVSTNQSFQRIQGVVPIKCDPTRQLSEILAMPRLKFLPEFKNPCWRERMPDPIEDLYCWCLNYTSNIPFSDYVDLYDRAAMAIESLVDGSNDQGNLYHPMVTGDASVSTLWCNDDWWMNPENCGFREPQYTNAHHVHRILPQAKIIIILRNPSDRLYSDFLFFQRVGKSQDYFHLEVNNAINSWNECILEVGERACVYNYTVASKSRVRLRLGLYQIFLQEWLSLYPRDQVMVVRLEDYAARPLTTVQQVYRFLDLRMLSNKEHEAVLERPVMNSRRESDRRLGRMLPQTRKLLRQFYRPYNQKLAQLLSDDRFLWDT